MRIFTVATQAVVFVSACENGFTTDARGGCVDVDECATGAHNCQAPFTCHNLNGSYGCDFGKPRADLQCGLSGDFATCSGLPWGDTSESFPCCNPKRGMCGNTAHYCACEGCTNYNSIAITYNNIEDQIFTSTYDDNVFGTLGQNRDFIINWAMNHIPSSTWLQEIIRRSMWQTQELSNYLKMSKCRNDGQLGRPIPTSLAAKIAKFQMAGNYASVFEPIIDHYLAKCSSKKNQILKHKMQKVATLILKACVQVSEQCPQFQSSLDLAEKVATRQMDEDEFSISRARPYFAPGGSFGNSAIIPYHKTPYYKKPPSRPSFGPNAGKSIENNDGFQTLYKRLSDGTYQMRRVLGQ